MENDLISRSALGIGRCNPEVLRTGSYASGWNAAIALIEAAPAVDAVEVVRCRNCRQWDSDPDTYGDSIGPKGKCMKSFETTICDDFCSYGERRIEDGK